MDKSEYAYIIVESFFVSDTAGRHGPVHIRPISGQDPYLTSMFVECAKSLSYDYPVGTKFRIKAKIVTKASGTTFIYSHYSWPFTVL